MVADGGSVPGRALGAAQKRTAQPSTHMACSAAAATHADARARGREGPIEQSLDVARHEGAPLRERRCARAARAARGVLASGRAIGSWWVLPRKLHAGRVYSVSERRRPSSSPGRYKPTPSPDTPAAPPRRCISSALRTLRCRCNSRIVADDAPRTPAASATVLRLGPHHTRAVHSRRA
jgi:hypothetical protein